MSKGTFCWAFVEKKLHLIILGFYLGKLYNIWETIYGICVKNAISVSRGTFWGKTNFWKEQKFSSVLCFARESLEFLANKSQQGFQHCITRVQMNVWRNFFLIKHKFFPVSPPDFEQTTLGLFAGKNQHSRQNCILRLQRNVLRFFSENLLFFSSLLDFICKVISNFWRQKCGLLVKNADWVSKGTFWKKRLFWKKYIFMSLLIVFDFQPFFSRNLAVMFQHGWSDCISPVRPKNLSKNFFL